MRREERALIVHKELDERFPEPQVPLYHKDPFTLLIAVLLSAQCTDERVNKVTPALFAKADTPEKMSLLSVDEINSFVRSCGLAPRKAQHIASLSQMLCQRHGGKVPATFEELEELPGVGHKTASVVMVQAFHQPAFPVDTHIHRLAQRWGLTQGKTVVQTEKDLKKLFPCETWNRLHLQIIYFGREVCPSRQCDGLTCSLCKRLFPNRKKEVKIHKT